jgi:hypothetical protein
MNWNILILHSVDGASWTHAVLYPKDWTPEHADTLAEQAFDAAQRANGDDWSWDDYEPELQQRGFVITNWHHGPLWDDAYHAEVCDAAR